MRATAALEAVFCAVIVAAAAIAEATECPSGCTCGPDPPDEIGGSWLECLDASGCSLPTSVGTSEETIGTASAAPVQGGRWNHLQTASSPVPCRRSPQHLKSAKFAGDQCFRNVGFPLLRAGCMDSLVVLQIDGVALNRTDIDLISGLVSLKTLGLKSIRPASINESIGIEHLGRLQLTELDLSGSSMETFDMALILQQGGGWSKTLRKFTLNKAPNLQAVLMSSSSSNNAPAALERLDISDNPELRYVCPWLLKLILSPSGSLTHLQMSNNSQLRLHLPSSEALSKLASKKLQTLDLKNSTIACDCNLSPSWLQYNLTNAGNSELINAIQRLPCFDEEGRLIESSEIYCRSKDLPLLVEDEDRSKIAGLQNSSSRNFLADPGIKMAHVNRQVLLDCPLAESEGSQDRGGFIVWVTPLNQVKAHFADPLLKHQPELSKMLFFHDEKDESQCQEGDDGQPSSCSAPFCSPPSSDFLSNQCSSSVEDFFVLSRIVHFGPEQQDRVRVVATNGSLIVDNFGWADRGRYRCIRWKSKIGSPDDLDRVRREEDSRRHLRHLNFVEQEIFVQMSEDFRKDLYNVSLIYGFATAGGFLLLTLLAKMVYSLLQNYGCCLFCCCCKDRLPPKARQLKNALDSIEAYRSQQLDRLRESYNQQRDWIRQNCVVQMERVRENYSSQTQNLRVYGTTQLQGVRDQYYEQMQRIRDYSSSQLERVNENYIFQRQRLRKFSAQNYLKMRETQKYTKRTLNKVMENLPALYIDLTACSQGMGQRQSSLQWEPNSLQPGDVAIDERASKRAFAEFLRGRYAPQDGNESVYFTPSGTPQRELFHQIREISQGLVSCEPHLQTSDPEKPIQEIVASNLSGLPPTLIADRGAQREVKPFLKGHKKSRSFSSHFLPSYWFSNSTLSNPMQEVNEHQTTVEVLIEHHPPMSKNSLESDIKGKSDETRTPSSIEIDVEEEPTEVSCLLDKLPEASGPVEHIQHDRTLLEEALPSPLETPLLTEATVCSDRALRSTARNGVDLEDPGVAEAIQPLLNAPEENMA